MTTMPIADMAAPMLSPAEAQTLLVLTHRAFLNQSGNGHRHPARTPK